MNRKDHLIKQICATLDQILTSIPPRIALAVSGGADSIFMLRVLDMWAGAKVNRPELHIISIDHDLRPSSARDAKFACDASCALGHKAQLIKWQHERVKSGVQDAARKARYALLQQYCKQHKIYHLLTAHNADDFLEDFIMSSQRTQFDLPRSSHNIFFLDRLKIIRPLYQIASHDIRDYLRMRNIEWMEDETNQSQTYERTRTRERLQSIKAGEIQKIKNEIKQVEAAAKQNQDSLIKAMAEAVCISNYGFASVDTRQIQNHNIEVKIHLLAYLLTIIGGNRNTPRLTSVARFLENLKKREKHTLHNCNIVTRGNYLIIYREFGKSPPACASSDALWDNRFKFQGQIGEIIDFAGDDGVQNLLKNISREEILKILNDEIAGANLRWQDAKNILYTMPVVKSLEKSSLKYHIPLWESFKGRRNVFCFTSAFRSRFTHFISKI